MQPCRLFVHVSLVVALLATSGCGGGGGGGGDGGGVKPPGSNGKGFKATAGPSGGMIAGLNVPVTLQFNKDVDPASVTPATLQVITVDDPAGQASAPGGIVASVDYVVEGLLIKIVPTVEFEPDKVTYGFTADALYEIAFTDPDSGVSIESVTGEPIGNPQTTFFFRTPTEGFDYNPGYPHARGFLVTDPASVVLPETIVDADGDGDVVEDALELFTGETEILPTSPVMQLPVGTAQEMLFIFDDAVQPLSVINDVDGSSPAIKVSINTVALPQFLPKILAAQYSFLHQQADLTLVRWTPGFVAYPPGSFVFVEVTPTVLDLAGNSKESLTGSGVADMFVSLKVAGTPDTTVYSVFEPFDDNAQEDASESSAEWAGEFPGQLGPVLGGGTGEDGPFEIDVNGSDTDPGSTQLPPGAVIDFDEKLVSLPVVEQVAVGIFEPREYELSSLTLPQGWTLRVLTDANADGQPDPEEYLVQSPGHPLDGLGAPLVLRCAGDATVLGTIDVSGQDGATLVRPEGPSDPAYAAYLGQGGAGATALQAAGDGGDGGDVLLLDAQDTVLFNLVAPVASPSFELADPKLRGATGRSTSLSAGSFHDSLSALTALDNDPGTPAAGDPALLAELAAGRILVQPNLGVGSSLLGNAGTANQNIDENHPTYVIETVSVDGSGTEIVVSDDPGDPTLTQPSDNIGAAPVSAAGDCYLVGRLRGLAGGDATPLKRGGIGAEPYVVVNEGALGVSTTGGGGGGGGAVDGGSNGLSDGPASNPLVNQRGGSGGIALDESPGAPGGLGAVRGTGMVMSDSEIDLLTQTAGLDLSGLTGAALVGSLLVPNAANDGWMFEISAFDGGTFTLAPIQLDTLDIGLLDGPGDDGPGLALFGTYDFVVLPPLAIGGAGGGGSGVSVTGTVNDAATVLPLLAPGAGGGAGGGSLTLETAQVLKLGSSARVLARGGAGGDVFDVQTVFAGGGGGGGGNVVLRAGNELQLFLGAEVSAEGGAGGSVPGTGVGGPGGAGYVRVENFTDSLQLEELAGFFTPELAEFNLGRQLGLPQGAGQSLFYAAPLVNPEWDEVVVNYVADTDGNDVPEDFSWSFDQDGAHGGDADILDPPVQVLFDTNGTNEDGFFDAPGADSSFYPPCDMVSARTGLAFDATNGVLLYAPGEDCRRIHRLDPVTLAPVTTGPTEILLPIIPSAGTDRIDVVSMAVSAADLEIFLLERVTRQVHVLDLATGLFKRTITLPLDLQGAMTWDATDELLLFADNMADRVVGFEASDATASDPAGTDYAPVVPVEQFELRRDGVPLDIHLVGLAHDAAGDSLWCTDGMAGTLFQVSLAPGLEGESDSGSEGFSPLVASGKAVVPSAVAFDGASLYLVHATDPADARVGAVARSAVSLVGADLVLSGFGTLLPEKPLSIADGDPFLRFRLLIDGVHEADGITFGQVRVNDIEFVCENKPF